VILQSYFTTPERFGAIIENWKNDYLRKQAEFQNFTKRKMNEVEELKKFALISFCAIK